ncbi:hypothetical protein N7462_009151 [Penicillium macrosclerotiorum]|uniref:uncharacterized protein n=1 Tax=Penicillium macrosclerotiorum TaxID=303699 RepID=UPI002549B3DC|nr:uncharacterized protein N7462_009151 [Penicillium macrosclerotiorum]KAJ5676254.1 hypothetical protein N7462_009151 [Penicillium macrosclerotiorum]
MGYAPKEGQMACDKKHMTLYTAELKDFRTMCLNILATHESTILETLWTEADGPGKEPTTDTEKAQLRLVTKVSFTKGKPDFPPPFTRLSDELVYLATKHLKAIDRGRNYPYDFHLRGDIHEDRVPSGISPIVWAHGLPFFPVYKGYYVLCGRAHADWVGWLLRARSHKIMIVHPVWTIGPVVAPGSAVALGRTVERQMVLHVSGSAKDVDRRWEKAQTARDIVSRAHTCGSVVPKSPTGGFIIAPIYQIQGYHVRCGPNDTALGRSVEIGRRTLMDRGVRDFDYDASLKRPYENEGDPAAFMEDDEDNDEDSNKNSSELGDWDKDDELFVMESEQSAETGEIVEEPPRRKAKDALSVIATSVGKKNSEAYIETPAVCTGNFNAKIALQRLKDITATISMKRPAETSDAPSTKVCRIKTTALGITAVKEIASAGSFISNEDIKAET